MQTKLLVLLVALASLASCIVADKAAQVQDPASPLAKSLHDDRQARYLKGTHKATKSDQDAKTADNEERGFGMAEVASKLKSIMGRNPNKLSKKKLEKVRSYAEDNPDKWYAMSYYLDYVYGISLVTLLAGGALWYHWRPAGVGGPVSN